MSRSRVVVVGGGITGLSCAWELARAGGVEVELVDASDRPGGKLRREPVAGVAVDVGAESMLARRPEAVDLVRAVGLGDDLVHPEPVGAAIWSRGVLHPMPRGTLMGIPPSPSAAAGILDEAEVARAEHEQPWPAGDFDDVSVGDYVAARLGDAVVDRLVEPLLAGVYAGKARRLSLRACLPQVHAAAARGESLLAVARQAAGSTATQGVPGDGSTPAPVFAGVRGGVGRLAETLAEQLRAAGATIRSSTIVRELQQRPGTDGGRVRWAVVTGPRPHPEVVEADAVVLATPATPTGRLLAPHLPAAARDLAEMPYASMAVVTLAVARDRGQVPGEELPGSGFLVPAVDGRTIKASTFTSTKWAWAAEAADDLLVLRASVGRYEEQTDLQRPDGELVALALAEVSEALGHQLPRLVDSHVQRWGGGLPQYTVGHVDRVGRIRDAVATLPGLEVAGAAYDGVGVPACIAGGRAAATAVLTHLRAGADRG